MIKRTFIGFFIILLNASCLAQHVPLESIADSTLGWIKIYKITEPAKPQQFGKWTYSANQTRNTQLFVEWMQQSYLPKGTVADAKIWFDNKTGSAYEDLVSQTLPQRYGAYAKAYTILKKDAKGKIVPETGDAENWRITVNELETISKPVDLICTKDQYYFTVPHYNKEAKQDFMHAEIASKISGFDTNANLKNFTHFYQPKSVVGSGLGKQYVVILAKDKQLPLNEVTIGEFFTKCEEQLPIWYNREVKGKSTWLPADALERAQSNLKRLKDKYKNKFNDVARLSSSGRIDFTEFINLTTDHRDMFDNEAHSTFPIYKLNSATSDTEVTKSPQWIIISWDDAAINGLPLAVHMHESIINNFNFDYVYNYFFDPEKVKGVSYKPQRSPTFKEAVVVTEASDASKKSSSDKSIFYFDDFSTTALNASPTNWSSSIYEGKKAIVTEPDGANGKWLDVKGNTVKSGQLKKPFPNNFELTFDVAVPQDFTWGGKRLELLLEGNNTKFSLSVRPGFGGREGEANISGSLGNGDIKAGDYLGVPGFSNNKKVNLVKVTIKKAGESLQVFIDKTKIYDIQNGVPDAISFNSLKFIHGRSDGQTERYFIGNIKITSL